MGTKGTGPASNSPSALSGSEEGIIKLRSYHRKVPGKASSRRPTTHDSNEQQYQGGRARPTLFAKLGVMLVAGIGISCCWQWQHSWGLIRFPANSNYLAGTSFANNEDILVGADTYPQLPDPPDPYAGISNSTKMKWASDCGKSCPPMKCAKKREARGIEDSMSKSMTEWMKITAELNITTFNAFGSLIASLYRNATAMRWDTDMDVWIWAHDTGKFEAYAEDYNKMQEEYKIVLKSDWKVKNKNSPNLLLVEASTTWRPVKLDIWAMYVDDHHSPEEGLQSTTNLQILDDSHLYIYRFGYVNIPTRWVFPLQPCYLEGVQTFCPFAGSKVLQRIYKINMREPNHKFDPLKGCWIEVDRRWKERSNVRSNNRTYM